MLTINGYEVALGGEAIGKLYRLSRGRYAIEPSFHMDGTIFKTKEQAISRLVQYAARVGIVATSFAA